MPSVYVSVGLFVLPSKEPVNLIKHPEELSRSASPHKKIKHMDLSQPHRHLDGSDRSEVLKLLAGNQLRP